MQSKILRLGKRLAHLTRKRLPALSAPFTKGLAYPRIRFSIFADACSVSATGSLEALSRSPAAARCWQPLLRASASARCDRSLWSSFRSVLYAAGAPVAGGRQLRPSSLYAPVAFWTAAVSPSIARAIAKSPSTMFDGSPSVRLVGRDQRDLQGACDLGLVFLDHGTCTFLGGDDDALVLGFCGGDRELAALVFLTPGIHQPRNVGRRLRKRPASVAGRHRDPRCFWY